LKKPPQQFIQFKPKKKEKKKTFCLFLVLFLEDVQNQLEIKRKVNKLYWKMMESETADNVSIKSSDSVTTSGEYEIVPDDIADVSEKTLNPPTPADKTVKTLSIDKDKLASGDKKTTPVSPILNIDGNGDLKDLEKKLDEVIHELDTTDSSSTQKEMEPPQVKGE
jgi:hypothetical protein